MTDDRRVFNDFVGINFDAGSGAVQDAYLVILLKDFTVLVFDANDDKASADIFGLCKRTNEMYGDEMR